MPRRRVARPVSPTMPPLPSAEPPSESDGAPSADPQVAPGAAAAPPSAPSVGWSPRDMLVPYVLLAVSLQRAHGYVIQEYLKSVGFFGTEQSTLYRTLRQLEKDGLLLSSWEPGPTGPARRVYSLTDAGGAWLNSWSFALETYRDMIDRFFGLYTAGRPAPRGPDPEHGDERP